MSQGASLPLIFIGFRMKNTSNPSFSAIQTGTHRWVSVLFYHKAKYFFKYIRLPYLFKKADVQVALSESCTSAFPYSAGRGC